MKVLVIGGADCVWNDVTASEKLLGEHWWDVVVAANDIASHFPRKVDYLCSQHPNKFRDWLRARAKNGHPGVPETVKKVNSKTLARLSKDGHPQEKYVDHYFRHPYMGGSSGLMAVAWAQHIGGTKIVCCGVPMERTPHFDESTVHVQGRPWNGSSNRKKWRDSAGHLQGQVKSMSMVYDIKSKRYFPSFTRQLLGAPTREWLEGADEQVA